MIRRAVLAFVLAACATPAAAQGIVFLPRYDFHLGAEHLSNDDPRFVWDTNFGGDVDFVDYGRGRTTFVANYEAVLGQEFRSFDPNQGNYLLDLSSSARAGGIEIAALLHHTSRHLSDRAKRIPIDWNMLGVAVQREASTARVEIHAEGNVLGVLLKSNVDYQWEANGAIRLVAPLRPHVSLVSEGALRRVGVDGTLPRGAQTGGRGEVGVRLEGQAGAIELFLAAERRIDAYPLDPVAMSWLSAGFRFVGR